MALDQHEVNLLVRAQLQGRGDIEKVTKLIDKLGESIDKQSAAAKRGEGSFDELKASLAALRQVQDDLSANARLISQFQKLGETIGRTEERVTKTAKAYATYETKLKSVASVTEKQQARLISLSKSQERAQATLVRQSASYTQMSQALREAGVATDNLAEAENRVRTTAVQIGQAMNKAQSAVASYTEDVRKARAAEKALADEGVFQKKVADAAKLAKSIEYVRFWEIALERADAAEKDLAKNRELTKVGDEAVETARKYTTLARAATDLVPRVTTLRDVIGGIVDPAAEARKSLDGVETEVRQTAAAIEQVKGPVTDYREQMTKLAAAQKSLQQQGSLVDSFRQQVTAVKAARAEFVQARAQVLQYAQGVRDGKVAITQLADAQKRLSGASAGLQQQVVAARAARTALREAGIASNDLATAGQRITSSAKTATSAMTGLAAAATRYGTASRAASESQGLFNSGGRTTLSLMQRVRGEVLALTSAYIGLQATIGLAGSSGAAAATMQGIENQLTLSVGNDPMKLANEIEYLRGQADRIGLSFEGAARSYAKYAAAASLAGRSNQEIRYIFETFAEVGRVANLTEDDMNGVFKALEQITSKGKIQAEELRGQLGDRLFGAFQVAATALNDQFPNLDKAMKDGLVTSEQLVAIAAKYREIVGEQLPAATASLAAEQDRFKTSVFDFKLAIADAGWAESYTNLLRTLNEFMDSEQGAAFAESIGVAFSALADTMSALIENFDEVSLSLQLLIDVFIAFKVVQAALGINNLIIGFKGLSGAMKLATKAFVVISALLMAWDVAQYLYKNFESFRVFWQDVITGFKAMGIYIKFAWNALWEDLPGIVLTAVGKIINAVNPLRKIFGDLGDLAKFAGFDGIAKTFDNLSEKVTLRPKLDLSKSKAQFKQEMAELVQDANTRHRNATTLFGLKTDGSGASGAAGAPTDKPAITPSNTAADEKAGKKAAAAAAKRAKEIETLTGQIEKLEARVNKTANSTLAQQLDAFDIEMAAMERRIAKIGDPSLTKRYEQARADARQEVITSFNDKVLADYDTLLKKVEGLDAAAGRKQKTSIDERRNAVAAAAAETFRQIDEFEARMRANADAARNNPELAKQFNAKANSATDLRAQAQAAVTARQDQEEMAAREAQLNALLQQREAILKRIESERKAGLISANDANNQTAKAIAELQPVIDNLTMSSREWAEAMRGVFSPEQIDLFLAKMNKMQASGGALQKTWQLTNDTAAEIAAPKIGDAIDGIATGFAEAALGARSWGDALANAGQVFLQFAADFLKEIAMMILKQALFNALASMGGFGGALGAAGGGAAGAVLHSGGIVGQTQNRTRNVSASWFANAPRYHSGGIAGLAPDEYPTILQRNEEVLTANDPRNILNGGGSQGGDSGPQSARFVLVDDRAKMAEAMRGAEGEQVTMIHLRRNLASIKQMLK